MKGGVKTGVTVFANIYEGVVNTVYEVGSGFSKGATKVVGAKYGKDAEEAADGVFEGVGNVAKIVRVPKDEAAKAFKEWYKILSLLILLNLNNFLFQINIFYRNHTNF